MLNSIINSALFLTLSFLGLLISCNTYKDLPKGQSNISFYSIYKNDTLNVKVNDSIRFKNHKIDMIFELGISKNASIAIKGNEFRVSGSFKTTDIIDKQLDLKVKRILKFDTILKAKNGRYIDIRANHKKIIIEQHKKMRIVE